MKRFKQFKSVNIMFLVMMLLMSQINIGAFQDNNLEKEILNNSILEKIVNTEKIEIEINENNPNSIDIQLEFDFDDEAWELINQNNNLVEVKFPKNLTIKLYDEEEDSAYNLEKDMITLDLNDSSKTPKLLKFTLIDILEKEILDDIEFMDYPILKLVQDDLYVLLEERNKDIEIKEDKPSESYEEEKQSNDEQANEDQVSEDQVSEDQVSEDQVSKEKAKLDISGKIALKIEEKILIKILDSDRKKVDETNPIIFKDYKDTNTIDGKPEYYFSLYTENNSEKIPLFYELTLDEDSLELITEESIKEGVNFSILENGEQVPFKYSYDFPDTMNLHSADNDTITIGDSDLETYRRSNLKRNNETNDTDEFSLEVQEKVTDIIVEESEIEIKEFHLQRQASLKIDDYIKEEMAKGKDLDTIKEELKSGIKFLDDSYKISELQFVQSKKEELENKIDYKYYVEDFLGMDQALETTLPIVPINSKDHDLNANKIEEIRDGFKITWDGIINTDRKNTLESLSLLSTAPNVVNNNDIKSWDIKTKVVIDYYEVLNNGELRKVEIDQIVVEETEKPMDFVIDLAKENIVAKYHVEQTYTNESAEIEVEGEQTFKLNAKLNNGRVEKARISKKYPSSLLISGMTDDESRPTSLVWYVRFNNNELIRKGGSGFVFDLENNEINQKTYKQSEKGYEEWTDVPKKLKPETDFDFEIKINGKDIDEDGRFVYKNDTSSNQIEVFLKEGQEIDEAIDIEISYTYNNTEEMKRLLYENVKIGIDAKASIRSISNKEIIEPVEEIQAKSIAILSILDKMPIMIDYRTNEIIWGVKINTATAQRLDLPGLTYIDKLGKGLSLENISDDHKVMLFKLKQGKGNFNDFDKFINDLNNITATTDKYIDEFPEEIKEMMKKEINPKPEGETGDDSQKTYNDAIEFVEDKAIFYLSKDNQKENFDKETHEYIYSEPKGQKLEMPEVILEGADEGTQKGDFLKDNDLRLDFVKSNQFASNPSGISDDNAYYFVYKTRLVNETATASVKNDAKITYARYKIDDDTKYEWVTPGMSSKKDLNDVGKYNAAPHKTSKQITAKDESGRLRHAVEWNIKFNYDVLNEKEVGTYTAKITDTISKYIVEGKLSNVHLEVQEINELILNTYTVDKSGKLISTGNKIILSQDEFTLLDNDEKIELSFEKELDPQYVYEFSFVTYINADELILESGPDKDKEESKLALSGKVKNIVKYERKYGEGEYEQATRDRSCQELESIDRVLKKGTYTANNPNREPKRESSAPKSKQEIIWELNLNESREVMDNLKITDVLIGKHSFDVLSSSNDFDKDPIAKLHNFKIEIQEENGDWIDYDKYTLSSMNGKTDENLDDWITGESGFIINFTETVDKPLRVTYSSYGHVVGKEELPLKNNAVIEYSTINKSKHKHEVVAQEDFSFTSKENYNKNTNDLNLSLRYDDNKIYSTSEINHGNPLTQEGVESVYAVLYRYDKSNVGASYIYRAGKFNKDANITFKNVEEGSYIVKQLYAPKGYYTSNNLGFALSDRNTNKDKAYPVIQQSVDNLVYVDVKEEKGSLSTLKDKTKAVDAAIYNLTPSIEISKKGVLKDESIKDTYTLLEEINLEVKKKEKDKLSTLDDSEFITNKDGVISIGKGKDYDIELDFNTFEVSEKEQDLNGYLHNTERKTLTVERNPSGTLVNNSDKLDFYNYKVNAEISNIDRNNKSIKINGSEFELYKNENGKLTPYNDAVSKQKKKDNVFKATNGILTLHNLDTGQYELKQTKAGDDYLINPVNLKFDVYHGEVRHEGKPELMKLDFENIKADLNVKNILEKEFIDGSEFEIINAENKIISTFKITDAENGYSQKIAPGKYELRQVNTSNNLPLRKTVIKFNVEDTEGVFEHETDKNIRNIVFENHLGYVKIHTHTSSNTSFDIKSLNLKYNGKSEIKENVKELNSLRSGKHVLNNIKIDEEWIYVNTNPEFTIAKDYDEAKDLETEVHLYASKAYFNYKNIDGDTSEDIVYDEASFKLVEEKEQLELNNDHGEFLFSELSPGKYSLSQIEAPKLYGLNTDVISDIEVATEITEDKVDIDKEKHTVGLFEIESQVFKNYRGKVELVKTSAELEEVLPGVTFDLYYEEKLLKENLITDTEGKINLDLLSPGKYKFVETKSDGNHVISSKDSDKLDFEIPEENSGAYYTIKLGYENHYADIIFRNTNPNGDIEYKDSVFKVEIKENGAWKTLEGYENISLDESLDPNYFVISGLKTGDYRLVQTKAPNKTIHNLSPAEFTVEENLGFNRSIRPYKEINPFINYQGNVQIDIRDIYGLIDHELEVKLSHEDSEIEYKLEQDGSMLFADLLEPGKYLLEVIKSDSAIIVDENIEFEIVSEAINDEDIQAKEEIRLTYAFKNIILKDGRTERVLSNGEFTLNNESHLIEDENLRIKDMAPGHYKLKQSKAAESYILNTLNHEDFDVKTNISEYDDVETDASGYPYIELSESVYLNYQQNLIVNKFNEDQVTLEGVEFTLSNGLIVNTDEHGQAKFMDLAPGMYVLEESKTLEGYELLTDTFEFLILEEAEGEPTDLEVTIINKKIIEPEDQIVVKPDDLENKDDKKEPMIPGLGMGNTTIYFAIITIGIGVLIVYLSKKRKDE